MKETGRIEAFSDGVFAIAITLLALELKVPHLSAEGGQSTAAALATSLSKEWPSYFAFLTSFFTVLIMWVHHHVIFRLVNRSDATLLFANGLLLMFVTVVPFSTAIVAEYFATPAATTACLVYAGTFVLIAISFYMLLLAAFRPSVLDPAAPESTVLRLRRDYRLGPPAYLVAVAAAPFSPWLAMLICTALWVFWAATTREC
jgi:uncharacterized membrane protein